MRCSGFLGAIGVARDVVRSVYPTGASLVQAIEQVRATEVEQAQIAAGLEANLDRTAAMHPEHDEFTITRRT